MIIEKTGASVARKVSGPKSILARSSVYRELLKEEREINRLKWIESEKSGHDIGIHRARLLWNQNHKNLWWNKRLMKLTKQRARKACWSADS